MDWKELGTEIAKVGLPLLGAALPVPGGAAIGAALASAIGSKSANPSDILATLTASADTQLKAKQFEEAHQEKLMQMAYDHEVAMRQADSADISSVNATMQAEASASASEAWYQKAWRPANGFSVALGSFVAVLFVCSLFYQAMFLHMPDGMTILQVVNVVPQLATAVATILAVPGAAVGIAAWHRGKMKREQVQPNANVSRPTG